MNVRKYRTFVEFLEGATGCTIYEGDIDEKDILETSYYCAHYWFFTRGEAVGSLDYIGKQHREATKNVDKVL